MSLAAGQALLHYRLVDKIGEGGMGVVWRARDTVLDREVAIKVLPDLLATDPERLARFEREAKLLASLSHTNIAAVYGLHEDRGLRFLAMELVPGEDLAARLARGALAADEAVDVARQIAEALEAAHESGVIHRDLKPANVRLTTDGKVKVLDFGLAKALAPEAQGAGDRSHSPTLTSAGTAAGVILGTAAYMSPEQAKGKAVDRRADIWAFGVVLYEMLTGRQPFRGESVSETLAAVLLTAPDLTVLPPGTPASVRRLLARCLDREPRQRLRDIGEARIALGERISGEAPETEALAPRRGPGIGLLAALLALAAALAFAAGYGLRRAGPSEAPLIAPLARLRRLTFHPGLEHEPALSPDGNYVAYTTNERGNLDVAVQPLQGGEPTFLTIDAADDAQPAWSPDGSQIAFVSARDRRRRLAVVSNMGLLSQYVSGVGGDIYLGPALGGTVVKLVEDGAAPAWSPAGDEIAFQSQRDGTWDIWIVAVGDGRLRRLTQDAEIDFQPAWSPDGRWIAHMRSVGPGAELVVRPARGGDAIALTTNDRLVLSPAWSPDGRFVYFASDRAGAGGIMNLWRIPFSPTDPGRLAEPERVTLSEGSDIDPWIGAARRLAFAAVRFTPDIWELTLTGRGLKQITSTPAAEDFPHVSRDGRLAMTSDRGGLAISLWVSNLDGSELTRLTSDAEPVNAPRWSPDGRKLAYVVRGASLLTRDPRGVTVTEIARRAAPQQIGSVEWSPDGKRMVYSVFDGEGGEIWVQAIGAEPSRLTSQGGRSSFPTWSPAGSHIAYNHEDDGPRQIWEVPAAGGEPRRITQDDSTEFSHPQWSLGDPDRILVVLDHLNLALVSARSGTVERLTDFDDSTIIVDYPSWSADGSRVYFSLARQVGDVYLLEGF